MPASRITAERTGRTCATRAPTPPSSSRSGPLEQMTAAFEAEYTRRFSFLMRDKPIIVEAVSVEVTGHWQTHAR